MKQLLKQLALLLVLVLLGVSQVRAAGAGAAPAQGRKPVDLSGKVLDTMDGGGYTYLLLQNGGEKVWVALPLSKVKVGQQVTLRPGFEMKEFASKSLNRKFDSVIFSAGFANSDTMPLSPSAMKMAHQGVPDMDAGKKEKQAAKPVTAKNAKVAKAKGANSYTVAEIFAKRGKLEKKQIVVRGRVARVASRIMKKNWVHIEDGSGSKAKKTDQLVLTTTQLPKAGDIVTATGTLYNDLDFGSGYRYQVLIQDAKLK